LRRPRCQQNPQREQGPNKPNVPGSKSDGLDSKSVEPVSVFGGVGTAFKYLRPHFLPL
jgi:hypothetical protein